MRMATARLTVILAAGILISSGYSGGDEVEAIRDCLKTRALGDKQTLGDVKRFIAARIPTLGAFKDRGEWEQYARQLRRDFLERIVLRGAPQEWLAPGRVEWLDSIENLPGYRIRKLRYEALPDLWIPALLYEPTKIEGRVPVVLNVNGHDPKGKAAEYEQIRCINLAKRGMLALHPEWFGMGQLAGDGFRHGCANQLDLCGVSGLTPFYLALSKALDLLLAHEQADSQRVAVTGLSGGGWQTIYISALDERVTLSNPVAGYTSLRTALDNGDMGDSEQCGSDLQTVGDLTHLTALRAPRPTLLTYNAADDCCFKAGPTLPPLLAAAAPVYELLGAKDRLRSHVNRLPGTHNYELDNRQAFYRFVNEFFYPGHTDAPADELPFEGELKSAEELAVAMPASNADFNKLARSRARGLPTLRFGSERGDFESWREANRPVLVRRLGARTYSARLEERHAHEGEAFRGKTYLARLDEDWSIAVSELTPKTMTPERTVILLADKGRESVAERANELLRTGDRVVAIDPLLLGEGEIAGGDPQVYIALAMSGVGQRPCAIQAAQVIAVAKALQEEHGQPLELVAIGPRSSLVALLAAALDSYRFERVELEGSLDSLKQLIADNRTVEELPEMFPFGLLADFDIEQLAALAGPGRTHFRKSSIKPSIEEEK